MLRAAFWSLAAFLLSANTALAACKPPAGTATPPGGTATAPGTLPNPIKAATLQDFADSVLAVVSNIGGILAVFFIIYAGFLFVTAGGNEEKRKSAKSALLYAVIGTAILIGARALSLIVCSTVESLKP